MGLAPHLEMQGCGRGGIVTGSNRVKKRRGGFCSVLGGSSIGWSVDAAKVLQKARGTKTLGLSVEGGVK